MTSARWSVFFCLLGLSALIPAFFVPAMLVANAVDGARYLSVWSGITTFFDRGHWFLAGLIFVFSMVFPLVKFGLVLASAGFGKYLSLPLRRRIIHITEWTAKYSMLDVYVIAMLVLLVKVDEYIRMLPSLGLYLFSFAVLCSIIASGCLHRAVEKEHLEEQDAHRNGLPAAGTSKAHRWGYLPWFVTSAVVLVCGVFLTVRNFSGETDRVVMKNLTKRPIPRSFERIMGLRDIAKPEHKFWSKETLKLLMDTVQSATTDAGWNVPKGFVVLTTDAGETFPSTMLDVDFSDPNLTLDFPLPKSVKISELASIEFRTRVEYAGLVPVEVSEEKLEASNDTIRKWHRDWFGRIFQFRLDGKTFPEKTVGLWLSAIGLIVLFWAVSGILCPKPRPPAA